MGRSFLAIPAAALGIILSLLWAMTGQPIEPASAHAAASLHVTTQSLHVTTQSLHGAEALGPAVESASPSTIDETSAVSAPPAVSAVVGLCAAAVACCLMVLPMLRFLSRLLPTLREVPGTSWLARAIAAVPAQVVASIRPSLTFLSISRT